MTLQRIAGLDLGRVHDATRLWIAQGECVEHYAAAATGHVPIGEDEVVLMLVQGLDCLSRVGGSIYVKFWAMLAQDTRQAPNHRRVIVDQ